MIDHYRQVFLEEAGELLIELEAALLELELQSGDLELIARVFRALHTIKGSSAMLGYDRITHFTHEVETVLDLVREGSVPVTKELVAVILAASDVIKEMIFSPEEDDEAVDRHAEELVALLKSGGAPGPSPAVSDPAPPGPAGKGFLLRYRPPLDYFATGGNPLPLFDELRLLGECRIEVSCDRVPLLDDIDPTRCYLSWKILLLTSADRETIRDCFLFASDDELEIELLSAPDGMPSRDNAPVPDAVAGTHGAAEEQARNAIASVRVPSAKLDSLVNLVGEMVTVQARLSQTAAMREDPDLQALAEQVERLTTELRDSALSMRMLPIGSTFSRFRRLVHDLARELGKEVEISISGEETELDKTVIELLTDPLVHLIRNSIDHGIELPKVREAAGKPSSGSIRLSATHSGDSVLITIADDGAGIDLNAVRERAIKRKLVQADAEMTNRELLNLVFSPGFSTSEEITRISGRGVGMDVVRRSVDSLRGEIQIDSREGEGTRVTIRIPLTLAIVDTLLVTLGTESYVLPLSLVEECLELTREDVAAAHGRHLIQVRDLVVPYIPLRDKFSISGPAPEIQQVVVTQLDGKRVGFVVDQVVGAHQAVIKSLGTVYRDAAGFAGATILGNGTVALILDIPKLVQAEESRVACEYTQYDRALPGPLKHIHN